MSNDAQLAAQAQWLVTLAAKRHLMIASAESCTGGWIAKCLTDVAGSSNALERGFVTYSNAAKTDLLGVDPNLIEQHGAVSEPVVRAMLLGALRNSRADLAVAVTGIAGPDGGRPDKPVGTVWLGWGRLGHEPRLERFQWPGDRDAVRRQAVAAALQGLINAIDQ